jgi:hypothetical protein
MGVVFVFRNWFLNLLIRLNTIVPDSSTKKKRTLGCRRMIKNDVFGTNNTAAALLAAFRRPRYRLTIPTVQRGAVPVLQIPLETFHTTSATAIDRNVSISDRYLPV